MLGVIIDDVQDFKNLKDSNSYRLYMKDYLKLIKDLPIEFIQFFTCGIDTKLFGKAISVREVENFSSAKKFVMVVCIN